MKNHFALFLFFLGLNNSLIAQISENTYPIWTEMDKINTGINEIIDQNISGKQLVLLGEAFHKSGSDLKAKTKFVKYLVKEKGFKNIIFESDFFALYFNHEKENIQGVWRKANQCQELFNFVKNENVTLWGMDSNLYSKYSKENFTSKLSEFLNTNEIQFDPETKKNFNLVIDQNFKLSKKEYATSLRTFDSNLDKLIENEKIKNSPFWSQALSSLKAASLTYREKNISNSIAHRDLQMASNLNFIVNQNPNEKFIVWAANAHIAKADSEYMGEATMGREYLKLNPNNSYHIAFSSIKMPYRKEKRLIKDQKSSKSLIHYLPNIDEDFFIDVVSIINKNPKILENKYYAVLWSDGRKDLKLKWFNYFDAIVFISEGELATYEK